MPDDCGNGYKGGSGMNLQQMKAEYERQQTHEGQEALRVKRELAAKFSGLINRPMKAGIVQPMRNGSTGKITGYFIAE